MSSRSSELSNEQVIATLNEILELELAGVVRYMHYSFMIFGHHRIPITAWLRAQSNEAMAHAAQAGEHITSLGGQPSLRIGPLEHEQKGLDGYRKLLEQVRDRSIMLEEFARDMIASEEMHIAETRKMMRRS